MSILNRSMVAALLIALAGTQAMADQPSQDNVTGTWSWTSYLLGPGSQKPGASLPTITAAIWAKAELKLVENPTEGDPNTISGELKFVPTGLTMKVEGRREGEGEKEELVLHGSGTRPDAAGKPPIEMLYEIRGGFSSAWPENGPSLSLRGYIRNVEGDPYAEKAIGAFVLVPREESPSTTPSPRE